MENVMTDQKDIKRGKLVYTITDKKTLKDVSKCLSLANRKKIRIKVLKIYEREPDPNANKHCAYYDIYYE